MRPCCRGSWEQARFGAPFLLAPAHAHFDQLAEITQSFPRRAAADNTAKNATLR